MQLNLNLTCLIILFLSITVRAQDSPSKIDKLADFPTSYFSKVENNYDILNDRVTRQKEKYLQKLFSRKKKLKRKLARVNSAGANQLFANTEKDYTQMISKVKSASDKVSGKRGAYIPMLDSVKTSLSFLSQNSSLLSSSKEVQDKLKGSLSQINQLQGKLQKDKTATNVGFPELSAGSPASNR